MSDAEATLAERPIDTERSVAPAEPTTARALWPTFMRRTLDEDALRREIRRPPR
jgi:hypothetical protein